MYMYDDLNMHVQMYILFYLSEIISGENSSPMGFEETLHWKLTIIKLLYACRSATFCNLYALVHCV